MGKSSYQLSDEVLSTILDSLFAKNLKNRECIKQFVIETFRNESAIDLLIELVHEKRKFVPLYIGAYVEVNPQNWWAGDLYEEDRLRDIGLLSDNNNLYGKIIQSTHWNDKRFNPFYHKFKVDLYLYDLENECMEIKTEDIDRNNIVLLESSDCIKYIKALNTE